MQDAADVRIDLYGQHVSVLAFWLQQTLFRTTMGNCWMSTISIRILAEVFETLRVLGYETDGLEARVGLEPGQLQKDNARVDEQVYFRCWDEAVQIAGPHVPLEVAKRSEVTHNILRFVCMPCATVHEALMKCCNFLSVITDLSTWTLRPQAADPELGGPGREPGAVLSIVRSRSANDTHRFANEYAAADVVALGRMFTGVPWSPRRVSFPHAAPNDTSHLTAFFGAPLRFGGQGIHLELTPETLGLPLLRRNAAEAAFFETHVATLVGASHNASMYRIVYDWILRAQPAAWPTLERVAEGLKISPRTLRRRLQSEQTSFQHVMDDCRFTLAKKHLAEGKLSLTELAAALGFAEPSTFYRAFRRWSGTTPQQFEG